MSPKRSASLVATIALAASPLAVAVAAAPADAAPANPKCITKAEFRKIQRGLTIDRVARIVGSKGRQESYSPAYPSINIPAEQVREHSPCGSEYGFVWITYQRKGGGWKVSSKTAYWG